MPRIAKDVIGEIVTQNNGYVFKVIKELERAWTRDRNNGYDEKIPAIRKFEIECIRCHTKREVAYPALFTQKNCVCHGCKNKNNVTTQVVKPLAKPKLTKFSEETWEPKLKLDGTVDTRYINKPLKEFVGQTFECVFDTFLVLEELPRVISKNGKHVYRNFRVECVKCKTQRETLAASLNAKGVACNNCRKGDRGVKVIANEPPVDIERKVEIMHEINAIWDEMKRMQREGKLTPYLVDKFEVNDWLLDREDETQHIERDGYMDDGDDIDYTDDSINWDDELDKYI